MNKGKLRELLKETAHLVKVGCHNEARIKIAVSMDLFDVARSLIHLDQIQRIERHLHINLERYRGTLTRRLLDHAGSSYGPQVRDKMIKALTINDDKE